MKSLNKTTEYQNNVASFNVGVVPEVLTEQELIQFLRIPSVSTANDHHNVIKNLIRFRALPRIHIGKKLLFPRQAILEWIENETIKN